MKLYKTTIVIWSDSDPVGMELTELARDAFVGDSYCSKQEVVVVNNPKTDPDWDGTEFFDGSCFDDSDYL